MNTNSIPMELDDYDDIIPLNFRNEKEFNQEIEEIMESTKDVIIDWKKRESAMKKLGGVILGNYGKSQNFIKVFNQKISLNLSVQMIDLRSSLMKEACRIAILSCRKLGDQIESAVEKMASPLVLYKLVGSANKIISETGSNCLLEILKNIESPKLVIRVYDQMKNKGITVRWRCAQQMLYIVTNYSTGILSKCLQQIEEFIVAMTRDASADVRSSGRKLFFKFSERFPSNGEKIFSTMEHNVQKAIVDEENTNTEAETVVNQKKVLNNSTKTDVYSKSFGSDNNYNNNNLSSSTTMMKIPPTIPMVKSQEKLDNKISDGEMSPIKTFVKGTNISQTETKKNILKNINNRLDQLNLLAKDGNNNSKKQGIGNKTNINTNINTNTSMNINNSMEYESSARVMEILSNNNPSAKIYRTEDMIKKYIQEIAQEKDATAKCVSFENISLMFNEIYSNIDSISRQTIKNLISSHISHLSHSNSKLTVQVMKNLTKFIFYLDDIFNGEDISTIVKLTLFNISSQWDDVSTNANSLMEIIRRKLDSNVIIKPMVEMIENETELYIIEICFEAMCPLIEKSVVALSDQSYLNVLMKKIAMMMIKSEENRRNELKMKILECMELIFRKYPKQLSVAYSALDVNLRKFICDVLIKYKPFIVDYFLKSGVNNGKKDNGNSNTSNLNSFNTNMSAVVDTTPTANIEQQQTVQNNDNFNFDISKVNFEILAIAKKLEFSSFINYIYTDPNFNIENFLLAIIKIKYDHVPCVLGHIYNILANDKYKDIFMDIVPLLVNRVIFIFEKFSVNTDFSLIKEILNLIPMKLDKEMYLEILPKYITLRQSSIIVQTLLLSIKNVISTLNSENLLMLLPSFIETVFHMLNHQASDVRKYAVYTVVDIYSIIGQDFETYLSELSPTQKNLIGIYMRKKKENN